MSKLPTEIRLQVPRATKKESSEVWEIEELFTLIQKKIEARETTEQVRAATDRIRRMGNLSNTPKQVNPASASTLFTRPKETGHGKVFNSNIQCVHCSQAHYSASCEQVKDNTERKNILLRDRRCFRCLKVGHREKDCRIRRNCRNCGLGHHQSICQRDQQPQTKNNCAVTGCASCQSSRAENKLI